MPIEGTAPISASRSPKRTLVNWLPASECVIRPARWAPFASVPSPRRRAPFGAHVGCHPPADDHPAERVDDEAHVGHPGPGRHISQVRHPQLVRGGPMKWRLPGPAARAPLVRPGGDHSASPAHASDAGLAHEPGHLVPADVVAGTLGGFPQLVGAVDRVVGLQDHQQDRDQAQRRAKSRAEAGRALAA